MRKNVGRTRILVTGGAGFIGSHLVDTLLERGDEVAVIDDFNDFYSPEEKENNVASHLKDKNFKLNRGDIRDRGLLEKVFSGSRPEVVVHLAARAGVRPSLEDPGLYEEVNVGGTYNLLELSKDYNVKNFVFASSSSVYGENKKVPFSESDPVDNPISPYAATKKSGELICYTYHHLYGLPVTCLRFFTVYGPRQRPDLAIRKFMERIDRGEKISVYGDGSMKRDFTYIDDIVRGIIASIDNPFDYEIINLGNSTPISVSDLVKNLEKVMGKDAKIKCESEKPGDVPITYASTEKAERLLGFSPATPIDAGLETMYKWIQKF